MAETFSLVGTLKLIQETQTFPSGFSKREFVIEVNEEKFPQLIKFECLKEKISLLDEFSEKDNVKVYFNIRGNEYNGKYFVNLTAWKIEANELDNFDSKSSEEIYTSDENDEIPF